MNLSHFSGEAHMAKRSKPAFPIKDAYNTVHIGMTLREYYIGQLLPYAAQDTRRTAENRAREIIDFADTVIEVMNGAQKRDPIRLTYNHAIRKLAGAVEEEDTEEINRLMSIIRALETLWPDLPDLDCEDFGIGQVEKRR